ncbi:MAG TPA: ATP-dependent DNA helicase [Methanoregulaceae archaeon]|nr:ATP-dependent DNA helicase [Methanoregulaceae archaeon]
MNISELPIPAGLRNYYARSGITGLYPPQAECVDKGMFDGKNLLVAIPTASGKTLIAEMAMHHHIGAGGKCLYIVPLKALASEKFEDFSGKGVKVGISTGDFDRRDESLGANDIIVATSEKVDSLIRNSAHWLSDISLLVVDEVHLIDSPDRGATVEMVITKMRFRNPAMQVIALSATIGNPGVLARWMDAELVTSEWRPVDLRQGVFYNGKIRFHDQCRPVKVVSKYDDLNLCLDTIEEGGQCLVFVSSRKNAEAFAKRAAQALKCESKDLDGYFDRLKKLAETDIDKTLAACVHAGAAFHHAGLNHQIRSIIEDGFRKGHIKTISSTPTLAAGLNLPARRVIIRDYRRFASGEGMVPIPVREYHQMAGRAGRPRLDPYGEAVLIAKDEQDVDALFEWYIDAPAEDIYSQAGSETQLCTHILSLIASGFVRSRQDITSFMDRTFFLFQHKQSRIIPKVIDRVIDFLCSSEMITINREIISATEFGYLVSRLYIDPRGAETIVQGMISAEEYSDSGLLQLICSTPDMYTLYVSNKDRPYLDRFYCDNESGLWLEIPPDEEEQFYRGLKTTMLLLDWSHELSDTAICERYSVGPGDIYSMVESINWLLHATSRLTPMFAPKFGNSVRELESCMKYGVKRELLPLVRLKNIGRVRARRLFNNGITGPEEIRQAGMERISSILGKGIAEQLFKNAGLGKRFQESPDADDTPTSRPEQSTLSHFGD